MENILLLTFMVLMAELFEATMQRSSTLLGVLAKLYLYYHKSVFFFFLIQPSFYVILFVIILTDTLNLTMVLLLALKIFDMFYKIELINQVFVKRQISIQIAEVLARKIPSWFFLIGVGTYPPLVFYALG